MTQDIRGDAAQEDIHVEAETEEPKPHRRYKFWESFKNIAILFSFLVNIILVIVLLAAVQPLFMAKTDIVEPLLTNLDSAFAGLGATRIQSVVSINDTMPVVFDLPLQQNTVVVLTEPVPLSAPATFFLPGGGGSINGTVSLNLPTGMRLPVILDMMVPVSTTIPVVMQVPVEIPLDQAGMGPAIQDLRAVFQPIQTTLQSLPDSPQEILQP